MRPCRGTRIRLVGAALIIMLLASLALFEGALHAKGAKKTLKRPQRVTRLGSGQIEMCLSCHFEQPDKAHSRQAAGCWSCHLGNPMAGTPELAHKGMVLNPGELEVADRTCGRSGCHATEVKDVKKTLMATNRGIISTLRFYWEEEDENASTLTVKRLMETGQNSPALDYFRKLCGTCHLWLKRRQYPGFLGEKGGGCTACHNLKPEKSGRHGEDGGAHPLITKQIALENCVRCHNRSGRIGLSYQGKYESEGYGTPFHEADFSPDQLPDGRFVWKDLPPDIHHQKGLVCIDCHTKKETMGDGKEHAHLEEQVEIECISCHTGQKHLKKIIEALDDRESPLIKITGLKTGEDGLVHQVGKSSKKTYLLRPPRPEQCLSPIHSRLSCQSCHAKWVPQCFGCHVKMDGSKEQLDKLKGRPTPGMWQEYRSFIRYESPALGVKEPISGLEGSKIVILVPG